MGTQGPPRQPLGSTISLDGEWAEAVEMEKMYKTAGLDMQGYPSPLECWALPGKTTRGNV